MLRSHIPSAAKHKKMSKVDTLRHAVEYIQSLQRMLNKNASTEDETLLDDEEDSIKTETPLSPPPEVNSTVVHLPPPPPTSGPTPYTNENYESGYETSSYYSNSMISPVPQYMYQSDQPPQYGQRTYYYEHASIEIGRAHV